MHLLVRQSNTLLSTHTLRGLAWGRMLSFNHHHHQTPTPTPYHGERWGFDNAAFTCRRQVPDDGYERQLECAYALGVPYLAVAPYIVNGGRASLDFSVEWLQRRLCDDWPWHLAVGAELTRRDVEDIIHSGWSGLFLVGAGSFISTSPLWSALAHEFGLKCHLAHVNTPLRLRMAHLAAVDSIDSTFSATATARLELFGRRFRSDRCLPR